MIKWGIIGTGYISSIMAKDFRFVTNGKLVAVSGTSLEKAKNFAQQYGIDKYYGDLESLLEDEDIDAVYIATPHPSHKKIAIEAMKAKKSVLCEKPMAINKADELEMVAVANEENVFLMEAFWTLYLPAMQKVAQWIKEGEIGNLRLIKGGLCFKTKEDETGRLLNPDLAGGALLDVGIYPVGVTNYFAKLVGAGELVYKDNIAQMTDSGVDGEDCITLQYANGLNAQLTCAVTLNGPTDIIFYGDKGRIEVPGFFNTKKATLYTEEDTIEFINETDARGYCYEVEAVNDLLSKGLKTSELITLEHSLEVIEILDSCRQMINLKYPFE